MFTGLVRECAKVAGVAVTGRLRRIRIEAESLAASLTPGASVAVDGVCLTVTAADGRFLSFEAVEETLSKTTLSRLAPGSPVHLEPALRLSDPLDGHLVYGHVDGVGKLLSRRELQGRFDLRVQVPAGLGRYLVEGGAVCVSGVSLTCFDVRDDECSVTLIPETLRSTKLGSLAPGEGLNIEVDAVGKFVEKMLSGPGEALGEKLRRWGYG